MSKWEIDEKWSLIELLECHELIDIQEELARRAAKKAERLSKR